MSTYNYYTTKDLAEAKYLINFRSHRLNWLEYKKKWPQDETNDEITVYFSFVKTPELEEDIKKYKFGDTTIKLTDEEWKSLAIPYRYPLDEYQDR